MKFPLKRLNRVEVELVRNNERGSTLVLALLIILVLSVLGISLMGNVVNENKRTNATESEVQARFQAKNGIVYFEAAFKKYIEENKPDITHIISYINDNYKDGVVIQDSKSANKPEKTKITAEYYKENNEVIVTSVATVGSSKKMLVGHYELEVEKDLDKPIFTIGDFSNDGKAVDFTDLSLAGIDLSLLNLKLFDIKGPDKKFYRVPDDEVLDLNILGPILNLGFGNGERFRTFEKNRVIATRSSDAVGLELFDFERDKGADVSVNLINYGKMENTNVLIDGGYVEVEILGIRKNGYRDIDFLKFGAMGNAIIQQDRYGTKGLTADNSSQRRFTFKEGLYVKENLTIGGDQGKEGLATSVDKYSNLMLRGNIGVMGNLDFTDTNLVIGDSNENQATLKPEEFISNIYVKGDVVIQNSCIRPKNNDYDFRLFSDGTITIHENKLDPKCNNLKGLFYAKDGFQIVGDKPITINGGAFSKFKKPNNLIVNTDPKYLETETYSNVTLKVKGKTTQGETAE